MARSLHWKQNGLAGQYKYNVDRFYLTLKRKWIFSGPYF